eukprot:s780_g18.t1
MAAADTSAAAPVAPAASMSSVSLWLALSPKQFADLNAGKDVHPDEHSGRFGLRRSAGAAVDRAQYFNDWTPDGLKGEYHQKGYVVLELEFTAFGYLNKMEEDVLQKMTPQEYRWYGPIRAEQRDSEGRLLYRFSDEAHSFT